MEKEREREGERQRDFYLLGVSSQNVIDYLSCIAPNLGDDHDLWAGEPVLSQLHPSVQPASLKIWSRCQIRPQPKVQQNSNLILRFLYFFHRKWTKTDGQKHGVAVFSGQAAFLFAFQAQFWGASRRTTAEIHQQWQWQVIIVVLIFPMHNQYRCGRAWGRISLSIWLRVIIATVHQQEPEWRHFGRGAVEKCVQLGRFEVLQRSTECINICINDINGSMWISILCCFALLRFDEVAV